MKYGIGIVLRFALAGVLYGAVFGALSWKEGATAFGAVRQGLAVGFFFGALLLSASVILYKASPFGLRDVGGWLPGERIIKRGFANMYRRGDVSGGVLVLTDRRLRFYGHRFNADEGDYSFALKSLQSVELKRVAGFAPASIGIRLYDGREPRFAVLGRQHWRDAIATASVHLAGGAPRG